MFEVMGEGEGERRWGEMEGGEFEGGGDRQRRAEQGKAEQSSEGQRVECSERQGEGQALERMGTGMGGGRGRQGSCASGWNGWNGSAGGIERMGMNRNRKRNGEE